MFVISTPYYRISPASQGVCLRGQAERQGYACKEEICVAIVCTHPHPLDEALHLVPLRGADQGAHAGAGRIRSPPQGVSYRDAGCSFYDGADNLVVDLGLHQQAGCSTGDRKNVIGKCVSECMRQAETRKKIHRIKSSETRN